MKTTNTPEEFFKAVLAELIEDGDMLGANYLCARVEALGVIDKPENPAEAFGMAALREAIMDSDSALAKRIYKRLTKLHA